jgi:hypothetical protein
MTEDGRHRVGSNVTAVNHQFTGHVIDTHTSYRVRRAGAEIVVGDTELQDGDEKLEEHLSYLVERNWDGAHVWMEPSQLAAGHLTRHEHVREASR